MKKLLFVIAFAFLLSPTPTLAQTGLTCVGLPPAYRTSTPDTNGNCIAGYKLGQITKDAGGNILKINYADGSTGDAAGNYTPPPSPSPSTPASRVSGGTNQSVFCTGGSCTYVPLEPLPGLPTSYGPNQGSFASFIGSGFRLLIGAGGLIAIVMIVLGALTYMFSDIVGNKKKALDRIRGAMWAVVLLVSSYLILITINPDLITFSLNLSASNNFTTAPNTVSATNPVQQTPSQLQAQQNSCTAQCGPIGGTVHINSGGYSCQCVTGGVPI
jgi:hypothetical protein